MAEKTKMLAGDLYNPNDPVLISERHKARLLFQEINAMTDDNKKERNKLFL